MDRHLTTWALVAGFLTLAGCGSSSSGPAAGANQPGADRSVHAFLEAVRTGQEQQAAAMLTKAAREKTAQMNLIVAPQGSDTAKFAILETEMQADGTAQVATQWTDVGDDGKPQSDMIVWLAKYEPEGWRVFGMASKIFDDQPALMLNFEDPEDMVRKQQAAELEMNRRIQAAKAQTTRAQASGFAPTPSGTLPPQQATAPGTVQR
ncbi:MAG: hypothetical protein JSS27_06550 [Planctomycetes bacterium]|nr:hypothetical protein [Planctomycetota bacterium]